MFICKHCNKQIPSLDDVSVHDCFIEKAVFMEENNNVLFYYAEDEREYSKILYCLHYFLIISYLFRE